MRKIICVFIGLAWMVNSLGSPMPELSDQGRNLWRARVDHGRSLLEDNALWADEQDNLQFFRPPYSQEEVAEFLVFQYPPPRHGLYYYYKADVDAIIGRCAVISNTLPWKSPWRSIAEEVLGGTNPFCEMPGLIALIEIRKVRGFKDLGQDFLDQVPRED